MRNFHRRSSRTSGFTLIELMIVIGLIAILAAISIPKLLEGKSGAYETSAYSYLRTLHQSELGFQTRNNHFGTIAELKAGKYLGPQDLTTYSIILTIAPDGTTFTATGTPLVTPTQLRHFFVDTTGIVRFNTGSPADATSPQM